MLNLRGVLKYTQPATTFDNGPPAVPPSTRFMPPRRPITPPTRTGAASGPPAPDRSRRSAYRPMPALLIPRRSKRPARMDSRNAKPGSDP